MKVSHRGIASRTIILLAVLAMLFSLMPLGMAAQVDAPALPAGQRPERPEPQLVPEEIVALFEGGITAQEFFELTGQIPNAIRDFIAGDLLVIIELEQAPAAVLYAELRDADGPAIMASIEGHRDALDAAQDQVMQRAAALDVQEIARYNTVFNGIQALVPADRIPEIAALPGVVAVHPAPIHEPALGASVPLMGVPALWEEFGVDGEGMVIAIIDTGIDYTHAALGGIGDPQAYALNDPDFIETGTFPTAKVIDGWDFAGTIYHAGCPAEDEAAGICSRVPNPDPDPLDEHGHGTHVASIAAGIQAGDVMTGTAPMAELMALKVFGESGSTALTINALEYATLSYMYHGYPHVINMSLGSNFGTDDPNDPSVAGTNNAAAAGIIVVASAGNAGNNAYITGSPATADKAISVAATTTGFVTGPTVSVVDAVDPDLIDIIYQPGNFDDNTGRYTTQVTAPLGYVGNLAGAPNNLLCTTDGLAPDALTGQIALIQRGACAFSVKVNNAAALGAVSALIYNNTAGIINMVGDPVVIPAASLQQPDGINLATADGEMVVVSAEDEVTTVPDPYTPADHIAVFSSRGPRGYDSALKPEISAPGVATFAADVGTGTGGVSMSGTSMAAPHVAGVAALVKQANPDWTPEQVKAAIMNKAVDLADGTPIVRSGSGRVEAYAAATTEVLALGHTDLVSLSWGWISSSQDAVIVGDTVTVHNQSADTVTYDVAAVPQPGAWTSGISVVVDPAQVTIGPGSSLDIDVTLQVDMTEIPIAYGPGIVESYGWITLTPTADATGTGQPSVVSQTVDPMLRVPYYAVPKPFAVLDVVAEDTITLPDGYATITLTHSGPIASDLWAMPALVAREMPNPAVEPMASLRMFGMDYVGFHPSWGDIIEVGINSWDAWHVPQPFFAEFDLYIDANQDGIWDYVNFNFNFGWFQAIGHDNTWVVIQVDLSDGMLYLASPFLIYTDYNNSYMEWLLPVEAQGLDETNTEFDYQLIGWDTYGEPDVTPEGSFDYAASPFLWGLTGIPGPNDPEANLFVGINSLEGHALAEPVGLMLIDYHGDPGNVAGAQAYLIPLDLMEARPFRYYLPFVAASSSPE